MEINIFQPISFCRPVALASSNIFTKLPVYLVATV